jgi:hypothetical protein
MLLTKLAIYVFIGVLHPYHVQNSIPLSLCNSYIGIHFPYENIHVSRFTRKPTLKKRARIKIVPIGDAGCRLLPMDLSQPFAKPGQNNGSCASLNSSTASYACWISSIKKSHSSESKCFGDNYGGKPVAERRPSVAFSAVGLRMSVSPLILWQM